MSSEVIVQQPEQRQPITSSTALKICFSRLCDFGSWIYTTTEARRRRFYAENPKIKMDHLWSNNNNISSSSPTSPVSPFERRNKQSTFGNSDSNSPSPQRMEPTLEEKRKIQQQYEKNCTLDAALVALSALDEQTTEQYVMEELQYYVLIQTVLHGDPLAEDITVAEASTFFRAKARRPVVSYQGFERLLEEAGVDEQGMHRLEALIDVQKAIYNKIAFLEDKDEVFARDQIWKEASQEFLELMSIKRRMLEVAELRTQLSRATNRKIEQAQILSSLGALHLEEVKKDIQKANLDSENAKKVAIAIEGAIAIARNTAEALTEDTGVNARFFQEEKIRVFRDCQDGCRDVIALAQERWSMLDLRMERLERLMTSIGRSAVVCSMTHLPLAEHQKLLPKNTNNNNNDNQDDDDAILDQSLEWLKLSTTEKFGLMSTCHVLRENDPEEHLVTSAVALTLSDNCVFTPSSSSSSASGSSSRNKNGPSQLDAAILAATVAFVALSRDTATSNLFLCASQENLTNALNSIVKSTILSSAALDEFLESLVIDLPGGVNLWRAAQQRTFAGSNNNASSRNNLHLPPPSSKYGIHVNQTQTTTMISSNRNKNVNTPGIHGRSNPSTQSNLRVGITPMDYSVIGAKSANQSNNNNNNSTAMLSVVGPHGKKLQEALFMQNQEDYSAIADVQGLLNNSSELHNNQNNISTALTTTSSRYADAEALVEAASSSTLQEFVRILTDVARVYLGKASLGCSAEFCLNILCQWKVTALCPLLPLLTASMKYLRGNQNSNNINNVINGDSNYNRALHRFQQRQQDERSPFTQQHFSNAWTRLVGSSDTQNPQQPTLGDVSSFLLAHFPDVIAAARGWDSSARAGFSGSELYVVRAVLYVLLVVGMKRNKMLQTGAVGEFDFVRHVGNYTTKKNKKMNNNNNNQDQNNQRFNSFNRRGGNQHVDDDDEEEVDGTIAQPDPSEGGSVNVTWSYISSQNMLDFISSRPCPWEYLVAAWPEASTSNHHSQTDTDNDDNNNNERRKEAKIFVSDDTYLFKQAIEECGLPSEVLQAFPAWETISGAVKRAEQSLHASNNNNSNNNSYFNSAYSRNDNNANDDYY